MQTRTDQNTAGIDVSVFQGTIDWNQVKNDTIVLNTTARPIVFAFVRAGSNQVADANFVTNVTNARAAGLKVGAYYVISPNDDLDFADDEAQFFIDQLELAFEDNFYGDLFPVMDFEILNGLSIGTALGYANRFRNYFERNTGVRMMVYTGVDFIQTNNNFNSPDNPLVDMPLWVAGYERFGHTIANPPDDAGGWTEWLVWQFNDTGNITGITQDIVGENVGTGDGTTTVFFLNGAPIIFESDTVYLNGVPQVRNTDYTINVSSGQITFTVAPAGGVSITADYSFEAVDVNAGPADIRDMMVAYGDFVEYISPRGERVTIGDGLTSDFLLRNFEGLGNTLANPQTQRAPFQVGSNLLNVEVQSRTIAINTRIVPTFTGEDIFTLREELSAILVTEPVQSGDKLEMGTLRFGRIGKPVYELQVQPRESPQYSNVGFTRKVVDADIEFFAPFPFWRDKNINETNFPTGGLEFPIEFESGGGIEFVIPSFTATVNNAGHVTTPILVEIMGECQGIRLTNTTTNKVLELSQFVASTEKLTIDTSFGNKSAILTKADGTEVSALGTLNLNKADFWQLAKGNNSITIEPVTITSSGFEGFIRFTWFNLFAGI